MGWRSIVARLALSGVLASAGVLAGATGAGASGPPGVINDVGPLACAGPATCWEIGAGYPYANLVQGVGRHRNSVPAPRLPGSGPTGSTQVSGLTCPSAQDCWGVGTAWQRPGLAKYPTYIIHWNGRAWRLFPAPRPKAGDADLHSVSCRSANDCWAVGSTAPKDVEQAIPLELHWDGKAWAEAPTVLIGGHRYAYVNSVSCLAAGCWAVGGDYTAGRNITLRLVGAHWVVVASPASVLTDAPVLTCVTTSDCWMVGSVGAAGPDPNGGPWHNASWHWNGHRWATVAIPSPGVDTLTEDRGDVYTAKRDLWGVACSSSRDCWAVGDVLSAGSGQWVRGQTLHWNGRRWSIVAPPAPVSADDGPLRSVVCPQGGPCWVGGDGWDAAWHEKLLLAHWNGKRWVE